MIWLRWLAVVPVAILAWYAAFLFGVALLAGIGSLCPPDEMVSGACVAWWFSYAEKAAFLLCSGLAGFLVVVSAAVVAPSRRKQVTWIAFGVGFVVAVYMAWAVPAIGELLTATVAGLCGVAFIARSHRPPALPKSPGRTP